jgi:cell wall-associated NlpC family hydrolase
MKPYVVAFLSIIVLFACKRAENPPADIVVTENAAPISTIETKTTTPAQLISFAQSLTGIPYKYASVDPKEGFDCSGFVTYVFNHFNIAVPRQSVGFTNILQPVDIKEAKPGDLILFTGTDSTIRVVGHMGIITEVAENNVVFIHSTSGKARGVTETSLKPYYQSRYMKTIRIFPQNNAGH